MSFVLDTEILQRTHAEAKLEIELDDLVFYPGVEGDSWGSRPHTYSFRCPLCKTCTDINESEYPPMSIAAGKITYVDSTWYHN